MYHSKDTGYLAPNALVETMIMYIIYGVSVFPYISVNVLVAFLFTDSVLNPQILKHTVYDAVMENAGRNQVLISLHLRKETQTVATAIRDLFEEDSTDKKLLEENSPSREELSTKATQAAVSNLIYMYMYLYEYPIEYARSL